MIKTIAVTLICAGLNLASCYQPTVVEPGWCNRDGARTCEGDNLLECYAAGTINGSPFFMHTTTDCTVTWSSEDGTWIPTGHVCTYNGAGATCAFPPVIRTCGNGILELGEDCDDGNTLDGDHCPADCSLEPELCGNGTIEGDERCDDGNNTDGDGCSAECLIE